MKRENPARAHVHVVDDDESFREAIRRRLALAGYTVLAYASGEEFLAGAPLGEPGCLLADLRMPGVDGLELQRRLCDAGSALPVVFLSGEGDVPTTVRAMLGGAIDFLTKPVDGDALVAAIERALDRDRESRRHEGELGELRSRYEAVTEREREVFQRVIAGRLNKQIAGELGVTERTVKAHRASLMRKLGADSVPDLVRFAEALGIPAVRPDGERPRHGPG